MVTSTTPWVLPEREVLAPGTYYDLPNERYHALDAISSSGLNQLKRSPAHYLESVLRPRKQTPALTFGSAFHTLVLEPERFADEYVAEPINPATKLPYDGRTKIGQEAKALLLDEHPGATILSLDDMDALQRMADSIARHPEARDYFTGGIAEASVLWDDPEHSVRCKVRPDYAQGADIRDLKTTTDARIEAFINSVLEYGYHTQAAMYLDGTGGRSFTFVAVEKTAPYAVMVYEMEEHFLDYAHTCYRDLLARYAACRAANDWPGYPVTKAYLMQPPWTMR